MSGVLESNAAIAPTHSRRIQLVLLVIGVAILAATLSGALGPGRFGPYIRSLAPPAHMFVFGLCIALVFVLPGEIRRVRDRARRYLAVGCFFVCCAGALSGLRFFVYLANPDAYDVPGWLLEERAGAARAALEKSVYYLDRWERAYDFLQEAPPELSTTCADSRCTYQTPSGSIVVEQRMYRSSERQGVSWAIRPTGDDGVSFWETPRSYDLVDPRLGITGNLTTSRLAELLITKANQEGYEIRSRLRDRLSTLTPKEVGIPAGDSPVIPLYDFMADSMCRAVDAGCETLTPRRPLATSLDVLLGLLKFFFIGYLAAEMTRQARSNPSISENRSPEAASPENRA